MNYKQMYGEAYVKTYLYAASVGCDLSFFPHHIPIPKKKVSNEFITRWLALWPKQSETGLDYPISGNKPECVKRFNTLLKQWSDRTEKEFNEDEVLRATADYIKEQRNKGWVYTKKNHKFILDENGSMLINYLERSPSVPQAFYL